MLVKLIQGSTNYTVITLPDIIWVEIANFYRWMLTYLLCFYRIVWSNLLCTIHTLREHREY